MVAANPIALQSTDDARAIARESGGRLAAFANRDLRVRIDGVAEPFTLPAAAVAALVDVLGHLADGRSVSVAAEPDVYTVFHAARMLGVSEPYLTGEIDAGKLPSHGTGEQRRIRRTDFVAYRKADDERRLAVMRELAAHDEELGLL